LRQDYKILNHNKRSEQGICKLTDKTELQHVEDMEYYRLPKYILDFKKTIRRRGMRRTRRWKDN
jgi:hypothetical protein